MPRLSFSKASVCLSVTYLSSLLSLLDLASHSNNPYTHYTPFVVEYALDGVPRLVPDPAHDPAIVVHVLFLNGQTPDVANHIFVHDLAVFVKGDLDNVPGLVHRTPHGPTLSIGVLVDRALGIGLVFVGAFGSVGSLTCSLPHGSSGLSGLIGHLSGSALYLLGGFSSGLLSLTRNALRLVSRLTSATLRPLRCLSCHALRLID
jgi:hypothetical protein